ncbi:copper radical oxidase [Pholiota conissans]|uniref:Copper radical oxidase n=1 Tax=Pholiota conissans TaxID=109636 RepID=A0A9P5ZC22_9AGAR|nr:copper radical oxidase [Pholiota conissans]
MQPITIFLWASLFLHSITQALCKEAAWNGHTTPGSTIPAPFTPYYVPPGAKSYDSTSPLISYKGTWTDHYSTAYIGKSLRSTSEPNAEVSFSFTGTGIEWFGNTDKLHGLAIVLIDGKPVAEVDTYSDRVLPLKQQRLFWKFDLELAPHIIKIVNTAKRPGAHRNTIIDLDAFIVTRGSPLIPRELDREYSAGFTKRNAGWTLNQQGTTGVHAMQLTIISPKHALIVDKVEHNPLTVDGHPAWAALYNLENNSVKPLRMKSNSFCAGGTFLGNGTLINVGGNPVVEGYTSAADFGDLDGLQSVRIFEPCEDDSVDSCEMYENHDRIRMASPRWYNTVIRIMDGSAMIIGGAKKGGWMNNATVNNPTIEYYPPKNIHGSNGTPVNLPFLTKTLSSNLFPIAFSLPDGKVFMAANQDAMIYDWETNTERYLPQLPNNVRVTYPMTGTALLLPLSPDNNYAPEILVCGGSTIDDKIPGYKMSSQTPASSQCSRMVLDDLGINAGWQVEYMPHARVMPDAVLLPTGQVLIVNGGATGISGYGNVVEQVGASNADNPVLMPILYYPSGAVGTRFSSTGMPSSPIPRLYHSVATLTPSGSVMIAGSNPNLDRSEVKYGTEYRVEWLNPPYMSQDRPEITHAPQRIDFGENFKLDVKMPNGVNSKDVRVSLMDLGYVTHAVHANSRLVYLTIVSSTNNVLTVQGPPSGNIYPPGPGWIYIVSNGVASQGKKVMIGSGKGPEVDQAAVQNILLNTAPNQYEMSNGKPKEDGSE